MPDRGLRSPGMRDLGPEEMARFRALERVFLDVTAEGGYREIRTPSIEPLHLYSASGTLSPQALERVYSFLDWNGWSGERVVLRPDTTVAVARWYGDQPAGGVERLSYVQPSFRFAPEGEREVWQCGVELFGKANGSDAEVLTLAQRFLAAAGVEDLTVEVAHAGLARAAFAAAGLSTAQQLSAYDRMLEGDTSLTAELAETHPDGAAAVRLLADVDGASAGYVANLRAAMGSVIPGAESALADLEGAAQALDGVGVPYRILAGTARNFEYYTGITFRFRSGGTTVLSGGRYDRLAETLGGAPAPACGWAADILGLIEVAS
ncbi:MAG: ATP phosphoribosyltransferase regulatory subunit [Dehalococcoidia bacterium]|nr:ATP phosphoribosyltransferase regulatory subunit [Dehalococcoidia bacterium]